MDRVVKFLGGGETPSNVNGLLLIHLNIFMYALCFWLQQPVLPYLSKELGADAVAFGTLQSAVSLMSLLGGAMMGRVSDEYGAKRSIMLSHLGSLIMYSLMGVAFNFQILLASRIPALLQHAMLCAQAALSILVNAENRAAAMGMLSLSYTFGMVFGSPSGGFLAKSIGYQGSALFAASLTLVILIIDFFFLPDLSGCGTDKPASASGFSKQLSEIAMVVKTARVSHILLFTFPVSMGIGSVRSMLPLAGEEIFKLESSDLGMYIGFAALIALLSNILLIKQASKRLGEYRTCISSALGSAVCYGCYTFVSANYTALLALTVPSTIASTLLYTLSSSLMSLAVDVKYAGTAISLSHGSRSLVGILSPLVGGFVYENYGFGGLGMFASSCCMVSAVVAATVAKPTLIELEALKKTSAEKKVK